MRNTGIGAHKPRAHRLLIGTNQADVGGSESSAGHRIARRHALPGGGGHQSFAQNAFWTDPRAGPIPPGFEFGFVRARTVPDAVAEQFSWRIVAQLTAH